MARSLSSEEDQIFNVIAGFFADVQTLELELGRVPRKEAGMMVLTEMSFEDKAVEIYSWVQEAVGDVAYEQCRQYEMYGEAWDEKATKYGIDVGYNAEADQSSWQAMTSLFNRVF